MKEEIEKQKGESLKRLQTNIGLLNAGMTIDVKDSSTIKELAELINFWAGEYHEWNNK